MSKYIIELSTNRAATDSSITIGYSGGTGVTSYTMGFEIRGEGGYFSSICHFGTMSLNYHRANIEEIMGSAEEGVLNFTCESFNGSTSLGSSYASLTVYKDKHIPTIVYNAPFRCDSDGTPNPSGTYVKASGTIDSDSTITTKSLTLKQDGVVISTNNYTISSGVFSLIVSGIETNKQYELISTWQNQKMIDVSQDAITYTQVLSSMNMPISLYDDGDMVGVSIGEMAYDYENVGDRFMNFADGTKLRGSLGNNVVIVDAYTLLSSTGGSSARISSNVDLYVSSTGNDNNTGTSESPFRTLNKAINEATKYQPLYIKGGCFVNINIESGMTLREQIYVKGVDLSYIKLCSTGTVNVNGTNFETTCDDARGTYPFIAAEDGGVTPTVACLFECTANSDYASGMVCNRGARGLVLPSCGFEGFHDGVIANNESSVTIRNAISRSMWRWGVHARHNGEVSARGCDCTACGNGDDSRDDEAWRYGASACADRCADIDAKGMLTGGSRFSIRSYNLSRVNANATSVGNVAISDGGMVAIGHGGSASHLYYPSEYNSYTKEVTYVSINANTLYEHGIVFNGAEEQ